MDAEIDKLTEFASWLTTRAETISVGASQPVYAIFAALEEFKAMPKPNDDISDPEGDGTHPNQMGPWS